MSSRRASGSRPSGSTWSPAGVRGEPRAARRPGGRPPRPHGPPPRRGRRPRDRLVGFTCVGAPEVSASLSVAFERGTPLPVDPASCWSRRPDRRRPSPEASPDAHPGRRHHLPLQRRHQERHRRRLGRRLPLGRGDRGGHPGDHRVRRLPRDGVRPRRLAHEQSTACREHPQPVVTRRRRVLPPRNIRPDPAKCYARRFPAMDEPRTAQAPGGRLVVVGGGMVAHRLVEALADRDDATARWQVDVFAEESRPPYDRVGADVVLLRPRPRRPAARDPGCGVATGVRLHTNAPVQRDRRRAPRGARPRPRLRVRRPRARHRLEPAVPPVPGSDLPGCFVYRTVDDVAELRAWATTRGLKRPVRGAVVGGGLLGLEAAGALTAMGVETTVVEFAAAADAAAGRRGRRRGAAPADRAARRHACARPPPPPRCAPATHGTVAPDGLRRRLAPAGRPGRVRHRRPPARRARPRRRPGVGERGGVVVDEALSRPRCRTSTRSARSPASTAAPGAWSLPATRWPRSSPTGCSAATATFPGADTSTKLKLLGVDVASFGDAFAESPGALEVVYADPVAGAYKKLVVSDDAQTLLGGVLVGDAQRLRVAAADGRASRSAPTRPSGCSPRGWPRRPTGDLPDAANVCSCNNVSAGRIRCVGDRRRAAPTSPA